MKILKFFQVILLLIFFPLLIQAQPTQFNINEYKQFLQSHQNMVTSKLLEMHSAGTFRSNLNLNYPSALYFDSIDSKYNLTLYEKDLINDNGFMVSERLTKSAFGEAFLEIYNNDLPVFVSTDAILHAFHVSYDRILKDVELGILIDRITSLLQTLHNNLPALAAKYSAYPEMNTMLKDVDVYLTVPRKLLDQSAVPYFTENTSKINEILNKISAEQGHDPYGLFSENCRIMDWSQFKPRGHYVDPQNPVLEKYFRVMMWLSRTEIYLLAPQSDPVICPPQTFQDIQRQTVDAMLIKELFDLSNANNLYEEIENIIKFFVGEQDNVTLSNLEYLKQTVQLNNASQLLDSLKVVEFQDTLCNHSFAYQMILSQILYNANPFEPDSIVPASTFMLFGQRFVIDSYVTGSVVYDRIYYKGEHICRLFPSTLDPMFALGNDAAAQLLKPELDSWHYSSNLAALRYLIKSYGTDFWGSTLYNLWLNSIRKLNPPLERNSLPLFMQTAAFWQEKLNTQLSSWTQLRHDNLLYAKQSYTGGTVCSYPYTYIEPFPEFYNNLKNYAGVARDKFQNLNFGNLFIKNNILQYLDNLETIMDTLSTISKKILDGIPFSDAEEYFLKAIIYRLQEGSGTPPYGGWYSRLFYMDFFHGFKGLMQKDHIVADIHTVPTDCGGSVIGAIPHVGTGSVNLGVFIAKAYDNRDIAFIGPVSTYYEYTTYNFLRLTDQEWESTYLQSALRPNWVNIYLADSLGNSKGSGPSMITDIKDEYNDVNIPNDFVTSGNYPNPFNPTTIIWFKIPVNLTNSLTELAIYDVNGKLINTLVNDVLPSGNYLVKWNGQNTKGNDVSSGIYFFHLKVADKLKTGKMILIR